MQDRIELYLTSPEVQGLSPRTQKTYRSALARFAAFFKHSKGTWTPEAGLYDFADFMRRRHVAGTTIQQYIICVKIFLHWNNTPVIQAYKTTNDDRKTAKRKQMARWFDESEVAKILAYDFAKLANPLQGKALVRLLLETGARVRELAHIHMSDVDVDDRIVWLHESKTEPRPAFFSPDTAEVLRQFFATKSSKDLANATDAPIFPKVDRIQEIVQLVLSDLGLKVAKDGRGPHTFRHYTASHLFYRGSMRIEDIAFLLGDKVETIVNHYLHPTPLMLRDRVDQAMGWHKVLSS